MKHLSLLLAVTFLACSASAFWGGESEIEPGDPEDIGPDAPQVTPPEDDDTSNSSTSNSTDAVSEIKDELRIDQRIRQILEHYKQDDPLGLPGLPIPDPMEIPDFKGNFPVAEIKFSEAMLHNLAKFRIDYVRTDLRDLKIWVGMTFDTLEVLGRYRMSSWFSTSSGDFNVTLIRVVAEGFVGLEVDSDGSLQASNITFDVGFKDIAMKFDNLGFFGNLFQGIINSVGTFIFDSIKPIILNEINDKVQTRLNKQMKELEQYLPDSIPPLDMAMALVRTQIQDLEMDPFNIPETNLVLKSGVGVKLYNGTIYGLSSIHRSGEVKFGMENGSVVIGAQAATQKLHGAFNWQLDFKFTSPKGRMSLEIDGLDVKIGLSQSLNVQNKPRLEVLKVSLGNIQARSRGIGSVDYLIEFAFNFLLNGMRSAVLRTMEKPVTSIIQKELDKLDVEAMIEEQLKNNFGANNETQPLNEISDS